MSIQFHKVVQSAAVMLALSASSAVAVQRCPPKPCYFEQGYEIPPCAQGNEMIPCNPVQECNEAGQRVTRMSSCPKFPAAFNAPAALGVNNSWDLFLTGSFIYWNMSQEGLDTVHLFSTTDSVTNFQSNAYKPGFKVGVGIDVGLDNWIGYAEYTQFYARTTRTVGFAGASGFSPWFFGPPTLDGTLSDNVASRWRLRMDVVDATLARPYYQGRHLIVTPFFGVRAAWLRQNMRVTSVFTPLTPVVATGITSHNRSQCWSIGPRAGAMGHWQLGMGFRIEGDVGGSILFTDYTKVRNRVTLASGDVAGYTIPMRYRHYTALRPVVDMAYGVGWGTYFDRQNYHFDVSATYDFMYWFGQNVMRGLVDNNGPVLTNVTGNTQAINAGDLFLHGLTLNLTFGF